MLRVIEHASFIGVRSVLSLRRAIEHLRVRLTASSAVALGFMLVSAGMVLAGAPGTWSLASSMTTPRSGPAFSTTTTLPSVLLPNGTVLVVGGTGDATSAELYNPATRTWTATGRAIAPTQSLMVLPNGKVLGAGELFDPSTGTWSPSNIPQGVLLPDGTILVNGEPPVVFDLQTGHSTPTGPHVFSHSGSGIITLLDNGKVLAAGGVSTDGNEISTPQAELYEPSTRTWAATGDIGPAGEGRTDAASVLLPDGKVLMAGGTFREEGFFFPFSTSRAYDPVKGAWSSGVDLGLGANLGPNSLTLLPDGRVLAAGGHMVGLDGFRENLCAFSSKSVLFDEAKGAWLPTTNTLDSSGRPGHMNALLNDGTVLLGGGSHVVLGPQAECTVISSTVLASAEIYTPPTSTVLPTSCKLTLTGTDPNGHAFIRVAARDIASGLQSVTVLQATNATVALPQFPPASRDPIVVTATKVNASQPSTLKLSVTNRAGKTTTCDPTLVTVGRAPGDSPVQVVHHLPQAESHITISNGTPGVDRVRLVVNGQQFKVASLSDGETRSLDVSAALRRGSGNTILIVAHGAKDSNAVVMIADS